MDDVFSAKKSRAICIGRHIIDFPDDMELSAPAPTISGWRITSSTEQTDEQFSAELLAKENELKSSKNARNQPALEVSKSIVRTDVMGKIFAYNRSWDYGFSMGKRVDYEGISVLALVRIGGITFTFDRPSGSDDDVAEISGIVKQLRARGQDEVPDEPGFCIENGFIADPRPGWTAEFIAIYAGAPARPDVTLLISSHTGKIPVQTLLQRVQRNEIREEQPNLFSTLYHGLREINGIPGEEASDKIRERDGTRGHLFRWESHGKKDDPMRPTLFVELVTGQGPYGKHVNSSLTDLQAQELWKFISSSVRLRPVSTAPKSDLSTEPVPIKNRVSAGEPCPAKGWWTCAADTEGYEVLGGATQHFQQGVQMPQAQLFGPMTFLDRMKGRRPTFTLGTPTIWTLAKERS